MKIYKSLFHLAALFWLVLLTAGPVSGKVASGVFDLSGNSCQQKHDAKTLICQANHEINSKLASGSLDAPKTGTGNPGEYLDDFKPSPTPVELIKNAGKQGQKTASIRFDHILDGNINSIGRGTGGHYLRSDNIRLKEITKTVDSKGVQTGYIQVRDPSTGRWVDKSDPSSFYPEHWSRRQTVQEIESAFKNSSPVPGTDRWRGKSPSGVTIEGYYTKPDGGAATAWPVQGG